MKSWLARWLPPGETEPPVDLRWHFVRATRPSLAARKAATEVIPENRLHGYIEVLRLEDLQRVDVAVVRKYWVNMSRTVMALGAAT